MISFLKGCLASTASYTSDIQFSFFLIEYWKAKYMYYMYIVVL